jgi:DhnA family fructose-bisphosphate aldolase class Ia
VDARTGKKIRLGRLIHPESGRGIIIAYSHGVLVGPLPGMESVSEMKRTAEQLRRADGIMIAPGLIEKLEDCFIGRDRPSLVVHLDWSNFSRSILPYDQGAQASLAEIEEVAAAGADAVMTYLLLGNDDPQLERLEIERNARTARACERLGIALIIEPRYSQERRKPEAKFDPRIMQLYCRISGEIGADIVKCIWGGSIESMRAVAETCPAPVFVAGGVKKDRVEDAITQAEAAMAAGCRGLVFGRNVYQADDPAAVLDALRAVVHETGQRVP